MISEKLTNKEKKFSKLTKKRRKEVLQKFFEQI